MENNSNKENFKNAICYIPFGGIFLFFTEKNKTNTLMKNIKYSTFLLIAFVLLRFIISGILMLPVSGMFFLVYAGISGFLGYKAYTGEKIDIEYIDDFEKKVKNNLK